MTQTLAIWVYARAWPPTSNRWLVIVSLHVGRSAADLVGKTLWYNQMTKYMRNKIRDSRIVRFWLVRSRLDFANCNSKVKLRFPESRIFPVYLGHARAFDKAELSKSNIQGIPHRITKAKGFKCHAHDAQPWLVYSCFNLRWYRQLQVQRGACPCFINYW